MQKVDADEDSGQSLDVSMCVQLRYVVRAYANNTKFSRAAHPIGTIENFNTFDGRRSKIVRNSFRLPFVVRLAKILQSITLFLVIFDPRSSIFKCVFYCHLSGVG